MKFQDFCPKILQVDVDTDAGGKIISSICCHEFQKIWHILELLKSEVHLWIYGVWEFHT